MRAASNKVVCSFSDKFSDLYLLASSSKKISLVILSFSITCVFVSSEAVSEKFYDKKLIYSSLFSDSYSQILSIYSVRECVS